MTGVDVRQDLTLAPDNKVHHVHTITRVAEMLEENKDWLYDVATEMDQEDGLIWVYRPDDTSVMAFTDFGIETLTGLGRSSSTCGVHRSDQPIRTDGTAHTQASRMNRRGRADSSSSDSASHLVTRRRMKVSLNTRLSHTSKARFAF